MNVLLAFYWFMVLWLNAFKASKSKFIKRNPLYDTRIHMDFLFILSTCLSILSRFIVDPPELLIAAYFCLSICRVFLFILKSDFYLQTTGTSANKVLEKHQHVAHVNLAVNVLTRVMTFRLARVHASTIHTASPIRMLLVKDPFMTMLGCVDAGLSSHWRCMEYQSDSQGCGLDANLSVCIPLLAVTMFLLRWPEWWSAVGRLPNDQVPFWILLAVWIILDSQWIVKSAKRAKQDTKRRDSNIPTSMNEFLAKSRLVREELECNPIFEEEDDEYWRVFGVFDVHRWLQYAYMMRPSRAQSVNNYEHSSTGVWKTRWQAWLRHD